jgi:aspartate ammonia-lyase
MKTRMNQRVEPPAPEHGTRTESDLIGLRDVLDDARHGIHTVRALENFPWPGTRVADVPQFARAFGMVKLAAVRANIECGVLSGEVAVALEQASKELAEDRGDLRSHLVVPMLQGGAGTSTNMNVNEVLANRALELLGKPPGSYGYCHPNDHVNRSQSTNDVYPTALRIALTLRDHELVRPALETLILALRHAAQRFAGVSKLGRTQLQDAVPMTVDQEIDAWADSLDRSLRAMSTAIKGLSEVNLGGTAIGTGLATPEGYRQRVIAQLIDISGVAIHAANRPVSATTDPTALLAVSAALRSCSLTLGKLANDLRLLSSGPRTGLAEYRLPALQAGSSMMPGKVNPVVPEFVNQVAFRIRGLDSMTAMALDSAQLQLNAMLPGAAEALFESQDLLACAAQVFAERCIDGIDLDEQRMGAYADDGLGTMTELAAVAGYSAAQDLTAAASGRLLTDVCADSERVGGDRQSRVHQR